MGSRCYRPKGASKAGTAMPYNWAEIASPRERQGGVNADKRISQLIEYMVDENRRLRRLAENLRAEILRLATSQRYLQ